MDDVIDNAVDELVGESQTEQEQPNEEVQEEAQQEGSQEEAEQETEKPDPWPKSAENALSRLKKQRSRYQAENAELRSSLDQIKAEIQSLKNPAPQAPREEDYETFEDFLMAKFEHKQGSQQEKPQEKSLSQEEIFKQAQEQFHYQERMKTMSEQAAKAAETIPEYAQLHAEYSDVMEDLPEGTVKAFLDLNNAPAAFYALAKEGKVEFLSSMPPVQAAMELARAEVRGEQMIQSRKSQQTKAPPPMKGVRGATAVGENIDQMSGDAILNAIRK